ncbi:MAG TPA: chromosome partitioning protein ParB, partial [Amaricoccus sp.]|nr:chromosome partitioning protein ParB [Amaricoccus sp.]
EETAQLIDHLKKPDMAKEAERLLADSGWLPEPLRLPAIDDGTTSDAEGDDAAALPAFLSDEDDGEEEPVDEPQTVAAE